MLAVRYQMALAWSLMRISSGMAKRRTILIFGYFREEKC
ncbi:hypothetical protein GJA_4228 [Janthinobacterium agaricidamnosum NBRC 102515 = DSM 9628]|uniref:Uncharacterized protein n=1 Tax=Janthinobacterium agaricidamnosum NBRC 102515 = DSM 9628 TaxID=1349767 RepID=W0VBV4_9BURK|nr:hypothetical protein GJA_4228 [Janthinobacterium agaricidamnosum NBRC 102515 = DSM 9628]